MPSKSKLTAGKNIPKQFLLLRHKL